MLDRLFAAQAARVGGATAIEDRHGVQSYGELAGQSDCVAGALFVRGVGPGVTVAVALQPDGALIAAMLGILKTGAAFVYVDLALPKALQAGMIERSGAACVIAEDDLFGVPALRPRDVTSADPRHVPIVDRSEQDAAFVAFTSGTTGEPKAIAVSHASAIHAYRHFWREADRAGDVSRFAVLSYFDWDVLGPLIHGRTCL